MITVLVLINGEPIYDCTAVNNGFLDDDVCIYNTSKGVKLTHARSEGFVPLVKKMLELNYE